MKAVHLSIVALIAAVSGIATSIATKNSEALVTAVLALVTAFPPAVQLAPPWFSQAPATSEMPTFEGIPPPDKVLPRQQRTSRRSGFPA